MIPWISAPSLARRLPLLALALIFLCLPQAPAAQQTVPAASAAEPGSELTIYLLTMGQGDLFWEKFGHNALWVRDAAAGTENVYNYGTFDFYQQNYFLRLIRGTMLYWLHVAPIEHVVLEYERTGRAMWAQELNLTPSQKLEMQRFLQWNAQPENREYVYDYYRDNCSTRLRDVIDAVVAGQLRAATESVPGLGTYRSHTQRLLADLGWPHPGMELALAAPADRPLTRWDELFLPMQLQSALRELTVARPGGAQVPLVTDEQEVLPLQRTPTRGEAPSWFGWYLAAGMLIAALIAGAARLHLSRPRWAWPFAGVAALWVLLSGFGGVLLLGLWLLTNHWVAFANENLLQFDPLALPLALLLPSMAFGARWAERPALLLALAVGALSLLGLALQLLPQFDQANASVIALSLPPNLALAWSVWALSRRRQRPAPTN